MVELSGLIQNNQVFLPHCSLDAYEGREVVVQIMDTSACANTVLRTSTQHKKDHDDFNQFVGGWESFNDDTPVGEVMSNLREGRKFDH